MRLCRSSKYRNEIEKQLEVRNANVSYFFFELKAPASNVLRFFDLFIQGVDGISLSWSLSSKFSVDEPIAPTIFRKPLNIPVTIGWHLA